MKCYYLKLNILITARTRTGDKFEVFLSTHRQTVQCVVPSRAKAGQEVYLTVKIRLEVNEEHVKRLMELGYVVAVRATQSSTHPLRSLSPLTRPLSEQFKHLLIIMHAIEILLCCADALLERFLGSLEKKWCTHLIAATPLWCVQKILQLFNAAILHLIVAHNVHTIAMRTDLATSITAFNITTTN